jgi:hypothetical protein
VKRNSYSQALTARDDGLRRVRKVTWRVGLLAAAAGAVIGARFAHLTAALPHLSTDGSSSSPAGGSSTSGPSSGISSPSGISPGTGGGVTTSGGS